MNITASSLTNGTLTVIVDKGDQILTARHGDARWTEIQAAYKAQDHPRMLSLLSMKSVVEEYSVGNLSVNSTGVTYRGSPLHTVDSNRVMAFLNDGLPYKPIANYISRKMANTSARAINELYSFLEHKNMPLTPDGFIVAYKGVQDDLYSVNGNKETVVLQGHVNEKGQILNTIGGVIEVERSSVDDDFRNGCSKGLHAGSLEYAKGWGKRVLLIEIDPADVVSVPEDCDCQKLRCCKYKVIGECTGPMPSTYTSEFSEPCSSEPCDCDAGEPCDPCDCDAGESCEWCDSCECEVTSSPLNKILEVPESDDNRLAGLAKATSDFLYNYPPDYIKNDEDGADSEAHRQYIKGYLAGYDQKSSDKNEQ